MSAAESSGDASAAEDGRLRARALGYLFFAGATIGLISLLLPLPARAQVGGLYSNVGLAYAGGLLLLAGAGRARTWMLHVALAAGTLLITRAVLLSGDAVSFYSVWFIWVGIYAFSFFSRRAAAGHMALVSVLYAATLAHDPPSSPVARWLTTVSTLIVAGIFIGTLVGRIRRQATAAAVSANSMRLVTELAHRLAAISEEPAARTALSEGALMVTDASSCALWEPDPDGLGLRATATGGVQPSSYEIGLDVASSALVAAFTGARPTTEGFVATARARLRRPQGAMISALWQPIVHDNRVIAILELRWTDFTVLADSPTLAIVGLLAAEAAVTLQRVALLSTLETVARTDELTGLPNRRAWHERLPLELARASRAGDSLPVAMIDLDHFKHYNDTNGHQAGDRLLKQIASVWSAELRETDLLVRYGGEEFALALPACPLNQALKLIDALRSIIPDGQSCSAGIALWNGSETADQLLGRADHALYEVKRTGRNHSAVAAPPASQPAAAPTSVG
jgi:diguanylate cyclase (GGDEF)-like protein